jgi:hypothetical protein
MRAVREVISIHPLWLKFIYIHTITELGAKGFSHVGYAGVIPSYRRDRCKPGEKIIYSFGFGREATVNKWAESRLM